MIDTILLATNNLHKVEEIQALLGRDIKIITPKELGLDLDVAETEPTLVGNACLKAKKFYESSRIPCLADDTGLFIKALNDGPGVHSARYAGEPPSSEKNIDKVLNNLIGHLDRAAYFRTVLVLQIDDVTHKVFEGSAYGRITIDRAGSQGFGYDSIFEVENTELTFAQMSASQKNTHSHRANALTQFKDWLINQPIQ